jgi:hypothetical protein
MADLNFIRLEIERMRLQVARQRREILQLQRARLATTSAEALLQRMLGTLDRLCEQRDGLKAEQARMSPRNRRGARHA